jgi:hypothetical protein
VRHRARALAPVLLVLALAASASAGRPVPGPSEADRVALATAEVSGWTCLLPHRPHPTRQVVRGPAGPAPLRVRYDAPGPSTDALPPSSPAPSTPAPAPVSPAPAAGAAPAGPAGQPGRPGYVRPVAGFGTGQGQNPRATLTGTLSSNTDTDAFALPLHAGDVLGVTVQGAGLLELYDPRRTLVEGSGYDRSVSYPVSSPLPGGGTATVDHVAAVTGTHVLTLGAGSGPYTATVLVLRANAAPQRFFLDYRGARVDTSQFGTGVTGAQPRTLDALATFLPRWGLSAADEPALTAQITRAFTTDLRSTGSPVTVTDSTTDPGGATVPSTSRLVIGGTVPESGIDTVGISDSVDPGNVARSETALVLLGELSDPATDPHSLNHYIQPGSNRIQFVGDAIGNIAAHEAGHLLGSWHTDPTDAVHNVMDSGDLAGAFGYGPDGVGGTADDTHPLFGKDTFAPDEGYFGQEDTRVRTVVGLSGQAPATAG